MEFSLLEYFRCLFRHHSWQNSRAQPGYKTCTYCGVRRRF